MDIGDPVFNTELEVDEIHDYIKQVLKERHRNNTFIYQCVYGDFSQFNTIEKIIELLGNASIYYDPEDKIFVYNLSTEVERWGERDPQHLYYESTFVVRHDGLDDIEWYFCLNGVLDKLEKLNQDVHIYVRQDYIINGKMMEVYKIVHKGDKDE